MSYRYHLYKVPKDFVNETQSCETLEQFREVYFKYLPKSKHDISISENTYSLYDIGEDLMCCEDGSFCEEMHLHGDTLFTNIELRKRFVEDDCIILDDKDGLKAAIEFCRNKVVDWYEDLLREKSNDSWNDAPQIDRMKQFVNLALGRWKSEWVTDYRPYNLGVNSKRLNNHGCWEFVVWDLVNVYKTFDWDNYSIMFMGW